MSLCFDRQGRPLETLEWAKLFENREYKRVALHRFSNGWVVSTVWTGLNRDYTGGAPLIFGTAIFRTAEWGRKRKHFGLRDFGEWDWHTEAEAREGHRRIAALVGSRPRLSHQSDRKYRRKRLKDYKDAHQRIARVKGLGGK